MSTHAAGVTERQKAANSSFVQSASGRNTVECKLYLLITASARGVYVVMVGRV